MTVEEAKRWINVPAGSAHAKVRLYCLPHAGAGAAGYFRWRRLLPAAIAVCPVQLPGREARLRELPVTDLSLIVDRIIAAQTALDAVPLEQTDAASGGQWPFAIFGHSMGALIAYEWASQLGRRGLAGPSALFCCGRSAPEAGTARGCLHLLPDVEFVTALRRRYGPSRAEVLDDPELRALFLPILRADLTLVETYYWSWRTPLRCLLVALAGESDASVSAAALAGWQALTTGEFRSMSVPGGHFCLEGRGLDSVLEMLTATLS